MQHVLITDFLLHSVLLCVAVHAETKASLTAASIKDGSAAEGSVCAAGQQAYTPTGEAAGTLCEW
jgi:hypothetical protein